MKLGENFLFYALFALVLLTASASYFRYMVLHDYLVAYEGECDPATNHCYVGCDNEECSEEYYYAIVTREATEIERLCGIDISDCEAANSCTVAETDCSISFCDINTEADSCEDINIKDS